ncbi:MAG: hypothetical protein WCP14_02670 [bacterium]
MSKHVGEMTEVQFRIHLLDHCKSQTPIEVQEFEEIVQEAVRRGYGEDMARQGWLVRNKKT